MNSLYLNPPEVAEDFRWAAVRDVLVERLGLYFPLERWRDLAGRLRAAALELGYADARDCLDDLLANHIGHRELQALASHLTVGESYFFRDPQIFAALNQKILPELIQTRRPAARLLRIWSAGCSNGEEAYSIALSVAALLPDLEQWQISILATDINPRALATGREGVYGSWSFRSPIPESVQAWLTVLPGERRAVAEKIKKLVDFRWLNLIEDSYPASKTNTEVLDVVFCRNVLMYFHPQQAARVLERLVGCLREGGWLIVSPVEASLVKVPELVPQHLPDLMLFRKRQGQLQPEAPVALPLWTNDEPVEPPRVLEAVEAPPPRPRAAPLKPPLREQAREFANQGRLAEALACYDQAGGEARLDPAWNYLRASVLVEQGRVDEASLVLRRVLYLSPAFVMAHFALGNLLLGRNQRRNAERHYRNALELIADCDPALALPEADGLSAERLSEIIRSTLEEVQP